jgi:dienelactone hydrolase
MKSSKFQTCVIRVHLWLKMSCLRVVLTGAESKMLLPFRGRAKINRRCATKTIKPMRIGSALLKCFYCCLVALSCTSLVLAQASKAQQQSASEPELKTASSHPIQYYLSLPAGWVAGPPERVGSSQQSPGKKWPVVVVIDGAERDFLQAATAFAQARGKRPFIILTPLVVTNGGAGYRSVPTYRYSDQVWDRIQNSGQFTFDMDGINAIMQDVVKQYGGEDKFFITGFEAGGHTVWGILFNHPEAVRGAALVCPNYLGRWVNEVKSEDGRTSSEGISSAAERIGLPIRNFIGTKDDLCGVGHPIYTQMQRAMSLADAHGYKNVSLVRVEGKGHEPLADEVLDYFSSLLQK